jgi:LEA14-like dessication related protein
MRTALRRCVLAVTAVVALSTTGCTIHVEQPRITPRDMQFTGIDGSGLVFQVTFNAYNPNPYELILRDLDAHLWLAGNDVGSTVTSLGATLPAMQEVPVTARVTMPWGGAPASLLATAGSPMVEYTLRGEVTVERYITVRTGFETAGTVPRSFFLQGAMGTVNGLLNSFGIPGVQVQ